MQNSVYAQFHTCRHDFELVVVLPLESRLVVWYATLSIVILGSVSPIDLRERVESREGSNSGSTQTLLIRLK